MSYSLPQDLEAIETGVEQVSSNVFPVGSVRQISSTESTIEFDGGTYLRSGVLLSKDNLSSDAPALETNKGMAFSGGIQTIRTVDTLSNGALVVTTSKGLISYSLDGITWTGGGIDSQSNWSGNIIHDGSRLLLVTEDMDVLESTDNAENWNKINTTSAPNAFSSSGKIACNGSGHYLMVCGEGYAYSSDCITWTYVEYDFGGVADLVYANGKYVVINGTDYFTSSNGTSWSTGTTGISATKLRFVNNLFIACGTVSGTYTGYISYSSDGTSWQAKATTMVGSSGNERPCTDIVYDSTNSRYVTFTTWRQYISSWYYSQVCHSTDLTNWTNVNSYDGGSWAYDGKIRVDFIHVTAAHNKIYGFLNNQALRAHTATDPIVWDESDGTSPASGYAIGNTIDNNTVVCEDKNIGSYLLNVFLGGSSYRKIFNVYECNSGFIGSSPCVAYTEDTSVSIDTYVYTCKFSNGNILMLAMYSSNTLYAITTTDDGSNWTKTYFDGVSGNRMVKFKDDLFYYRFNSSGSSRLIKSVNKNFSQTTLLNLSSSYSFIGEDPFYITEEGKAVSFISYSSNYYIYIDSTSYNINTNGINPEHFTYKDGNVYFVAGGVIYQGAFSQSSVHYSAELYTFSNNWKLYTLGDLLLYTQDNTPVYTSVDGIDWNLAPGIGYHAASTVFLERTDGVYISDNGYFYRGVESVGSSKYVPNSYTRIA